MIPVWNEQGVIGSLVEELERDVLTRFNSSELIVVDDASTDGTGAILTSIAERNPRIRVERAATNRGHGPSVRAGLARADAEWIFQLDSDGQFDVGDFWTLWEQRELGDLILGVRAVRHDPRHRLVLSRVIALVVSALAGSSLRDPNTPFRLVRRTLLDDLRPLVGDRALAPNILGTVAAAVRGWRIAEVPVTHRARVGGKSSLQAWRLIRFSLRGLGQLLAFRFRLAGARRR